MIRSGDHALWDAHLERVAQAHREAERVARAMRAIRKLAEAHGEAVKRVISAASAFGKFAAESRSRR